MRVVLSTEDRFYSGKPENIASALDAFDPTFSKRYLTEGPEWQGVKSYKLRGEMFRDADKFNIFYLTIDPTKIQELTAYISKQDWSTVLALIDESYDMTGDALYVAQKPGRPNEIPVYVRVRD